MYQAAMSLLICQALIGHRVYKFQQHPATRNTPSGCWAACDGSVTDESKDTCLQCYARRDTSLHQVIGLATHIMHRANDWAYVWV
jgi:hypothetical protein